MVKIQTKIFLIHLCGLFVEVEAVAFTYAESQPLCTFMAKFISNDGLICRALALEQPNENDSIVMTVGLICIDNSSTRASR